MLPGRAAATGADGDLFLLGLEEHFATPELMRLNGIRSLKGAIGSDINDVGAGRIADMNAAGIDIQVLSALTPGPRTCPGPKVSPMPAGSIAGSPATSFRPIRTASTPSPRCR